MLILKEPKNRYIDGMLYEKLWAIANYYIDPYMKHSSEKMRRIFILIPWWVSHVFIWRPLLTLPQVAQWQKSIKTVWLFRNNNYREIKSTRPIYYSILNSFGNVTVYKHQIYMAAIFDAATSCTLANIQSDSLIIYKQ